MANQETQTNISEVVDRGKFLSLESLNGWEFAARRSGPNVVAIIGVTTNSAMLLTEQFRVPLGRRVIDLPAGLVGDDTVGESIDTAAAKELSEEVGYSASDLKKILSRPTSPGLTNEMVSYYLAQDLRQVSLGGGVANEQIEVHAIPLGDIDEWLIKRESEGILIDPKVDVALRAIGKLGQREEGGL